MVGGRGRSLGIVLPPVGRGCGLGAGAAPAQYRLTAELSALESPPKNSFVICYLVLVGVANVFFRIQLLQL